MRFVAKAFVVMLIAVGPLLVIGCKGEKAKRVMPPPQVTVVHPVQKEVTRYLEYTGTTAALESVDIRARVSGFLEKICFEPRAKVKAGDLLFVIDPRQYQAMVDESRAKLKAQKASSKLAQTDLQIAQQLESKEAISALRLEKKSAERDVAGADVDLAQATLEKASLDLEWTKVTSPIDGRVSRNLVDVGNLVGSVEKTLLTTVVNDSSVYVYFNASELDMLPIWRSSARIRDSSFAAQKIPVYMALADETDFPHKGFLDFADTKIDPSTGTLQMRGIFDNPDGLLMGGMFVRVRVPLEKKATWVIPEVALQRDQGGPYVLTVSSENVVEQRRVKVGTVVEGVQAIEQGLTDKDAVIAAGLQRARPGSKVNPVTSPPASPQTTPEEKGKAKEK